MKKFFIFLGVLVGVVLAAVLIIGAIEPKDIVVTRTLIIKAPRELVFDQMVNFKNWTNWSPWYKMDTTMKLTYFGTDGKPGSGYSWVGSEKTGAGSMKNTGVNGSQMDFEVNFTEPRKGTAQGVLKAEDTAGFTRATWSFSMHMPYPMNAMCLFMNMDKMLGGDFETGLNYMRVYLETSVEQSSTIDIEEVVTPARIYEGVRQMVKIPDMDKFFMDNYVLLKKGADDKINGSPVGIFYTFDTATKTGDVVAAVPVSDTLKPVKGASFIHVDMSKAYKVVTKGPYSKLAEIHVALRSHLASKGQVPTLIMEEYEVGKIAQPDSNKWVTNIYYLIK